MYLNLYFLYIYICSDYEVSKIIQFDKNFLNFKNFEFEKPQTALVWRLGEWFLLSFSFETPILKKPLMICDCMRALEATRYSVQPKFTKQTTGRFNSSRRLPNPENALCANFILNCKRQARKNHPSLFNKNGKSQSSRSNFFKKIFILFFIGKGKKNLNHIHIILVF